MLGNFLSVDSLRKFYKVKKRKKTSTLPSLYQLYNERDQRPWEVRVRDYDRMLVDLAWKKMEPVYLSGQLTDVELLKLHAASFPEFDNQLIYHKMFNIFEVRQQGITTHTFSYDGSKYVPVPDII